MSDDESLEGNTIINSRNLQSMCKHQHMKDVEDKDDLFLLLPPVILLSTTI
jgi:hypothetical protein